MKPTAEYVGLRQHARANGEPFLAGMAHREFTVPAGARLQLRRQRKADDQHGPAFVLQVLPPDPRGTSKAALAAASLDNAPAFRIDLRDEESAC